MDTKKQINNHLSSTNNIRQIGHSKKDWFVLILLIIIILLVLITMSQIDRQWDKLTVLESNLEQQNQNINLLRQKIVNIKIPQINSSDSTDQNQGNNQTQPTSDAFTRALAAKQNSDYAVGDWNVKSFGTQLATISPIVSSDAYASRVQGYVLETLLTRDPDTLEWIGLLAKNWQVSDDGLTVIFTLNDNIHFSDGVQMTADDVVFSYNFIMDETIAAPRLRAYYEKLKSVKKIDKLKVEFEFKEPYFEILSITGGLEILAKHFYQEYLEKPNEFNSSKGLLFGSGPYRLANPKTWTPDIGQVELVRNQSYWGKSMPPINKIIWKIIQNDSARLTTYRNGDIDHYSARPIEYQKLLDDKQIMDKSHNYEYMPPVVGYSYIAWNQKLNGKKTRFADVRVRRAMTALTDVDRIIKDIFLDYAQPAVSPFSPTSKQHNQEFKPQPANLIKAKELLSEAGYEYGDNNILVDQDGQPFEFKLTYFQANEDTNRMVLLLKDLYAEAGIKLIPDPQEWPVMLQKLNKSDYQAITLAWTSGIETNIYQMFHSSQIKVDGDNFINYHNPKLDKLIEEAQKTTDEEQRMKLWREAEGIIIEDQPYTFLKRNKSLVFIDKRFKNINMSKLGLNYSFIPMEIYVPSSAQKYQN